MAAACAASESPAAGRPYAPRPGAPRIVMLVGLPGSGKSSFAASLARAGWGVCSSDELRSRKGQFETSLGIASKSSALSWRPLVVDKCCVAPAERKRLLDLMYAPEPKDVAAIFFNKTAEDCIASICSRKGHPTISLTSPAACGRIVDGFVKKLVPPTEAEGFGSVLEVTSHDEADALLRSMFDVEPIAISSVIKKFPRTHHLMDAGGGGVTRDDLVMSAADAAAWVKGTAIIVEEKIDGANLGVSLAADYTPLFQNRGNFVNSATATQWRGLDRWWSENASMVCTILEPERHVLFGEWMAAKHSIHYTSLPGYFIAFDVFDQVEGRFLSRSAYQTLLEPTGIPTIRIIAEDVFDTPEDILPLLETISAYGARRDGSPDEDSPVEGVYLRVDEGQWLNRRCKIVRPDFIQGISQHWMTKGLVKNQVKYC